MFRYRRYRVFLVFAFIAVVALYEFGSSGGSWSSAAPAANKSKDGTQEGARHKWSLRPEVAKETKKFDADIPIAKISPSIRTPPIVRITRPGAVSPTTQSKTPKPTVTPTPIAVGGPENDDTIAPSFHSALVEVGVGRLEVTPLPSGVEPIHWRKQSEHFPVASTSMIKLPTGAPKPIPKIQFTFEKGSLVENLDRESKLGIIKGVFQRSWDGYKKFAWLQDELRPVTGTYKNPFATWGATLVDTLDTLWIMGMKDEFEEAVKAVDQIDFTTTPRADIPLFETTIRYLGGLLAAYDLSGSVHKNLLTKAVELAELLISAFDTPNRMPVTYYMWRPDFTSNPHRASNRLVLAELGSLSVEFTRLAQITKDDKYYDAIARITDELEKFQDKTRLPGMWPTFIDASGCKPPDWSSQVETPLQAPLEPSLPLEPLDVPGKPKEGSEPTLTTPELLSPGGNRYIPLKVPPPVILAPGGTNPTFVPGQRVQELEEPVFDWGLPKINQKRQLDVTRSPSAELAATSTVVFNASPVSPSPLAPACESQGLTSSSEYGDEDFTLGGMSDSTYEYLPKEWLLLGGQIEKYRTMYEKSVDVVKDKLLFRPMLPNGDDILFSGKLFVSPPTEKKAPVLEAENAHLTCFAGGMFGMGAKIYNRPDDLEIAKKLTEGCVWSYNMTTTGIMPEAFIVLPCESMEGCEWNETKYWDALDPGADLRLSSYQEQIAVYDVAMASASAAYAEAMALFTAPPVATAAEQPIAIATPTVEADTLDKRQLADLEEDHHGPVSTQTTNPVIIGEDVLAKAPSKVGESSELSAIPSRIAPVFPAVYSPNPPRTHRQVIKSRIQEERLPPGVVRVTATNYILRPEAIESVWYMYRITGDSHWREVGWTMFEAVNKHTAAKYGNSAIDDVTKSSPEQSDEMESFWLAETMKYFYLLFADEDVINLDEWVLNTEAHPFRRPT